VQIPSRQPEDVPQLQECIRRERHSEQADRYRVALLAIQGQQTQAIQQALTRSRGFVQRWAYAYRCRPSHEAEARPSCPRRSCRRFASGCWPARPRPMAGCAACGDGMPSGFSKRSSANPTAWRASITCYTP
jgi:hypothetical protein